MKLGILSSDWLKSSTEDAIAPRYFSILLQRAFLLLISQKPNFLIFFRSSFVRKNCTVPKTLKSVTLWARKTRFINWKFQRMSKQFRKKFSKKSHSQKRYAFPNIIEKTFIRLSGAKKRQPLRLGKRFCLTENFNKPGTAQVSAPLKVKKLKFFTYAKVHFC